MGCRIERKDSEGLARLDIPWAFAHRFFDTFDDVLLCESVKLRPVCPQSCRDV